jgi:hypothetical protein
VVDDFLREDEGVMGWVGRARVSLSGCDVLDVTLFSIRCTIEPFHHSENGMPLQAMTWTSDYMLSLSSPFYWTDCSSRCACICLNPRAWSLPAGARPLLTGHSASNSCGLSHTFATTLSHNVTTGTIWLHLADYNVFSLALT